MSNRPSPFSMPRPAATSHFFFAGAGGSSGSRFIHDATKTKSVTKKSGAAITEIINVDDDEAGDGFENFVNSSGAQAASSTTRPEKKTAPVCNKVRGSKKAALELLRNPAKRKAALEAYRRDKRSAGDTSCFNLATWEEYHT